MTTATPHPVELVSVYSAGHELVDGRRFVTTHLNQGRKALTVSQAIRYAGALIRETKAAGAAARHRGELVAEPGWPSDRYELLLAALELVAAEVVDGDPRVAAAAETLRSLVAGKVGR